MRFAGYVLILSLIALLFGVFILYKAGIDNKEQLFKRIPAPLFRTVPALYEPLQDAAERLKAISHASAVIEHAKELGLGTWSYIARKGKLGLVSVDYSQYQKLVLYARIETGKNAIPESEYSYFFGTKRLTKEIRDYGSFFIEYGSGFCIISNNEYQNISKENFTPGEVFELTEKSLGDYILKSVSGNGSIAICDNDDLSAKARTILDNYRIEELPLRFFLKQTNE
ncbi:hypothetical protein AT15_10250 [Kosmotoga arenicorallina S304]|uniref:Uncharacterized protein n=1 Tax=Kosmotoga arenicorallina S304 TaxID=1453497 RepID=A0A176K0Q9_9BACT|nr:hypothetical protein [Kosmotoga arenicorallina]OAA30413.1 hypothetical protein AT15_10250 [Kosmotoga arenicorallina S304]